MDFATFIEACGYFDPSIFYQAAYEGELSERARRGADARRQPSADLADAGGARKGATVRE